MDVTAEQAKKRRERKDVEKMMTYEKELQEALLRVLEEHKPRTKFEFGVQLGYLHAIARATVTGRCGELDDKLFEFTQAYRGTKGDG